MQMYQKNYVGIDVSKPHFDASLLIVMEHEKQDMKTIRFSNDSEGLKSFLKWLKEHRVSMDKQTLCVLENTGVYHRLLWQFCGNNNIPIHIGNAAHMKWSFGITRGKNDVIDSKRICHYAYKHADELKDTPALNPVFLQLKDLMTGRTKLLDQKNSIKTYLNELKLSNDKATQKILAQSFKASIEGIKKSIIQIENEINKLIIQDEKLNQNFKLVTTVPGVGKFTALYILCSTNNFATKISGKQLASYAGVVPFEHSSGISIKGGNHVHKMANKELKKLLHMCALSAIKYYPEFKTYFDRKKAEGKNGMSVLNAIKNKIVIRVAAVVNNQKPYVDNYSQAA
jgi:transposase